LTVFTADYDSASQHDIKDAVKDGHAALAPLGRTVLETTDDSPTSTSRRSAMDRWWRQARRRALRLPVVFVAGWRSAPDAIVPCPWISLSPRQERLNQYWRSQLPKTSGSRPSSSRRAREVVPCWCMRACRPHRRPRPTSALWRTPPTARCGRPSVVRAEAGV
jgi:hypothetical protein